MSPVVSLSSAKPSHESINVRKIDNKDDVFSNQYTVLSWNLHCDYLGLVLAKVHVRYTVDKFAHSWVSLSYDYLGYFLVINNFPSELHA
jgi:hypothetical protein